MPSTTESTEPVPGSPVELPAAPRQIEGRSLGRIAWTRFKRDRVAVAGGVVVILLVLVAVLAKPIESVFGLSPDNLHQDLLDADLGGLPSGSFGGVSLSHPLGIDPLQGRDLLARVIDGSWVSLLVAFGATVLSNTIGTVLGVVAGYYGGWVDAAISRVMDVFLAFPLLLFAISISASLQGGAFGMHGLPLHISVLIFVIGFFNWPYMGRIVRGQTLSLREREFVDAARSLGARGPFILFKELLPNLTGPILVYSTLLIPTNILFEAGLSFLGVGIQPPQSSWGGMLNDAIKYYQVDPEYLLVPGLAIFVTVLAFNLLGDGLRDALDPRGN
ncbi:ABC transporter permease [Kitasatospora sp. NPDC052896]|uniref:ABC transporter permease n=1 Tax=Kitasatospora sp. NPDC052896 TaxID=3364061 RepID=UPI0037C6915D